MKNKNMFKITMSYLGHKAMNGLVMGMFVVLGAGVTIYAGSFTSTAGITGGASSSSMVSLEQFADDGVGGNGVFNRDTDSLEAISNKINALIP